MSLEFPRSCHFWKPSASWCRVRRALGTTGCCNDSRTHPRQFLSPPWGREPAELVPRYATAVPPPRWTSRPRSIRWIWIGAKAFPIRLRIPMPSRAALIALRDWPGKGRHVLPSCRFFLDRNLDGQEQRIDLGQNFSDLQRLRADRSGISWGHWGSPLYIR